MGHKKSGNSGWHEIDDASATADPPKKEPQKAVKPSPSNITETFKSVCVAGIDSKGQVQATMYGKEGNVLAQGKDFKGDSLLPDFLGPKPLSADWKGVGDSETPQRYRDKEHTKPITEARQNEDGFRIDVPNKTCTVTTVDGGGVPNKPVSTPLVIKTPGM